MAIKDAKQRVLLATLAQLILVCQRGGLDLFGLPGPTLDVQNGYLGIFLVVSPALHVCTDEPQSLILSLKVPLERAGPSMILFEHVRVL